MKSNINFITLIVFLTLALSACSPRVTVQNFGKTITNIESPDSIVIYSLDEEIPIDAEVIGSVEVDNQAYTFNCSYDEVLKLAMQGAYKIGGNAIKITSHKHPNMVHSCHRLEAVVLNAATPGRLTIYRDTAQIDYSTYALTERNNKKYPKLRWALNGNWSYMTAKGDKNLSQAQSKQINRLRDAFGLGSELTYYLKKNYGMGAIYSFRRNSIQVDNRYLTLHYIAPTYNVRYMLGSKKNHHLLVNMGIGYLGYRCKIVSGYSPYTGTETGALLRANMLATSLSVGYDYLISNSLAIGIGVQYIAGSFGKVSVKGLESSNSTMLNFDGRENVSRLELSLGVRFLK